MVYTVEHVLCYVYFINFDDTANVTVQKIT